MSYILNFEKNGITPKGNALYYCEYNNNYHISMEYNITTKEQKFYVIHHESDTICYELPETFNSAREAEKVIKYRD
jgi:hypothetical protein